MPTRRVAATIAACLVLAACSAADDTTRTEPAPVTVTPPAPYFSGPEVDAATVEEPAASGDAATAAAFHKLTTRWNNIAGPFVAKYVDPNGTAADVVKIGGPPIERMERTVRKMGQVAGAAKNPKLADVMAAVVVTYRDKLAAVIKLVNALSTADPALEQQARADLAGATKSANDLAGKLRRQLAAAR